MSRIVSPSNAKMPKLTKRTRCRSLGSPGSSHSKRSSWTTAADALSQTAIFFEASMHASTGIPMVSHTSWSSRRSRRRCSARGFPRRLRRGFGGQLPRPCPTKSRASGSVPTFNPASIFGEKGSNDGERRVLASTTIVWSQLLATIDSILTLKTSKNGEPTRESPLAHRGPEWHPPPYDQNSQTISQRPRN